MEAALGTVVEQLLPGGATAEVIGRSTIHALPRHLEAADPGEVVEGDEPGRRAATVCQRPPEAILALCGGQHAADAVERLAAEGYRVLAVAEGAELGQPLTLSGFVALEDPVRPEAGQAIATVQQAGARVFIATGDHPELARAVARRVGLPAERVLTGSQLDQMSEGDLASALDDTALFARVAPEHKLRLVQALQRRGDTVAMTGDGINAAPALKAADVGLATGRDGTDAAREAASVVLTDDRFASLAEAIREGRGVESNLRKGIRYYLAAKVALVAIMLLPALLGLTPPLSPAMIILVELFMDLAASTALVAEPPEPDLMTLPPRPANAPFFDRSLHRGVFLGGGLVAAATLAATWLDPAVYATAAFVAWVLGIVLLAFRFRTWRPTIPRNGWLGNRVLNEWAAAVLASMLLVVYLPPLEGALGSAALPWRAWGVVMLATGLLVGVGGQLAASPK